MQLKKQKNAIQLIKLLTNKKQFKMKNVLVLAKNNFVLLGIIFLTILTSCNVEVPPGTKGMLQGETGLTGEILEPGRRNCWWRDQMRLIDYREETYVERMEILCPDKLNFKFDLYVTAEVEINSEEEFMGVYDDKGSRAEGISLLGGGATDAKIISFETLYQTYIQSPVISRTKQEVGKYETTVIPDIREEIQADLYRIFVDSIQKIGPMRIKGIAISNLDYPDKVTNAYIEKRREDFELEKQTYENALNLLKEDNLSAQADKDIILKEAEGEAEAAYLDIVNPAIAESKRFIRLKKLENKALLYNNAKGKKTIIVGETSVIINK